MMQAPLAIGVFEGVSTTLRASRRVAREGKLRCGGWWVAVSAQAQKSVPNGDHKSCAWYFCARTSYVCDNCGISEFY